MSPSSRPLLLTILFQGILCLALGAQVPGPEPNSASPLVVGWVQGGSALVARSVPKDGITNLGISRATLQTAAGRRNSAEEYEVGSAYENSNLTQWRIVNDILWIADCRVSIHHFSLARIPLDEVAFFSSTNPARGEELRKRKYGGYAVQAHDWCLTPVRDAAYRYYASIGIAGGLNVPPVEGVFCDFFPRGKDSVLVFILEGTWKLGRRAPGTGLPGRMTVWRGKGTWQPGEPRWEVAWPESAQAAFDTPFHEPFVVYGSAAGYFFLTESGQVYFWDGKGRSAAAVWAGAARPVRVAVGDAASGKVFLFGVDGAGDRPGVRGFFFELSLLPRPQLLPPGELAPADAKRPLETVLARARLLKALNRIK
jgi:hypothetical protein